MLTVYELARLVQQYRRLVDARSLDQEHLAPLLDRQCAAVLRTDPPPSTRGRMVSGPSRLVAPNPDIRLYEGE